jgi:hypothetical protein
LLCMPAGDRSDPEKSARDYIARPCIRHFYSIT